jgi:hypothetical protein
MPRLSPTFVSTFNDIKYALDTNPATIVISISPNAIVLLPSRSRYSPLTQIGQSGRTYAVGKTGTLGFSFAFGFDISLHLQDTNACSKFFRIKSYQRINPICFWVGNLEVSYCFQDLKIDSVRCVSPQVNRSATLL